MISLKTYLEQNPDRLLRLSAEAYRQTLAAIAGGAAQGCPFTGEALQKEILSAGELLKNDYSAETLGAAKRQVIRSLHAWGERSEAYFKRRTCEIKELLKELAGTADCLGKRDQRYTRQLHEVVVNLEAISHIDDLGRLRATLLHSAAELKSCVERMAQEGSDAIARLEQRLASHRVELEHAQELASLDPLTGLYNRREVEARISRRLAGAEPFCVVIIDLDNFKTINDQHGHLIGDELLRQIARELRLASRAEDIIGRWGGDEFVLVFDGSFANTKLKVQRMRPWVFGTYELKISQDVVSVVVNASIGMAAWAPGETMLQVLSRADADMYREKAGVR